MKCGLLGQHLTHSYSPAIHRLLGDYAYELFEIQPEKLEDFLQNGDFSGLNVTIPYKKAVIPYMTELTPIAQKLGAVNTIVRRADGCLVGHNTDYFGFSSMIRYSGLNVAGKKCLVLGSGGASNTAVAVLEELGATAVVISRRGENNYQNLHLHQDAKLIVNATPVGMYPNCGVSPIDLSLFANLEGVLDLIYNPARTKLLLDAECRGLVALNGLWMLVAQAKESAEFFTGKPIDNCVIPPIFQQMKYQMENILLIGMPGCGKSTVGAALAAQLDRPFVDIDIEIEKQAGKSIAAIFAQDGEKAFRQLETEVLQQFTCRSGLVISTGGGCVTERENWPLLRQNSSIIWLQRALSQLPTQGRPLSRDLPQLYARRKDQYAALAHRIIDNNGPIERTINQILEEYP